MKETLEEIHLSQKEISNTLSIKQVVSVSALYDLVLVETQETFNNYLNIRERKTFKNEKLFMYAHPDQVLTRIKKVRGTMYEDNYFSFCFC